MSKGPSISVILPAYNHGSFIDRAIDSVLNQEFDDFELIIVDDGSTDNTTEIVNQYSDDRIRLFNHSTNMGGAAARNTGIHKSSGEYIAFLDADDEWAEDKLSNQLSFMESREGVASYCDARVKIGPILDQLRKSYKNLTSTKDITGIEGGEELIPELLLLNFTIGGSSTLMVNREALLEIGGFDEDFRRHQDLELLVRLLRVGKIAYLDEELVVKHETGRPSADMAMEERYRFLEKFSEEVFDMQREGVDVINKHRLNLSYMFLSEGRFSEAAAHVVNRHVVDRKSPVRLAWYILLGIIYRLSNEN